MFDWNWRETLKDIVVYAAENPGNFIYYVLLCLSPFFLISAVLSWQLAKQIEQDEKEKKRKAKRDANIAKARRAKGHSHWQNIQKTKQSKDAEKNRVTQLILREVRVAILDNKGVTDPKLNLSLGRVLEKARKFNVAMSSLERTIKQASRQEGGGNLVRFGFVGFKGCSFIVEAETDKAAKVMNPMQHAMKKAGFKPRSDNLGAVLNGYDQKGVVEVVNTGDGKMSEDDAVDLAINAGAEEVTEATDGDGNETLEFVCDMKDLHKVKEALEAEGCEVASAGFGFIPKQHVSLTEEEYAVMHACFTRIYEIGEVLKIYNNIE